MVLQIVLVFEGYGEVIAPLLNIFALDVNFSSSRPSLALYFKTIDFFTLLFIHEVQSKKHRDAGRTGLFNEILNIYYRYVE
jgi:hypothetical protein